MEYLFFQLRRKVFWRQVFLGAHVRMKRKYRALTSSGNCLHFVDNYLLVIRSRGERQRVKTLVYYHREKKL